MKDEMDVYRRRHGFVSIKTPSSKKIGKVIWHGRLKEAGPKKYLKTPQGRNPVEICLKLKWSHSAEGM